MRSWLRFLVNAVLGKVPGKTGRPDTATRMAMDADFIRKRRCRTIREVDCTLPRSASTAIRHLSTIGSRRL